MPSIQSTYSKRPSVGIAGQLYDALNDGRNIHPMFNADTAAIPYGHAVEHVQVAATSFAGDAQAEASREARQLVKLPNANTDKIFGLLMHSHSTVEDVDFAAGAVAPAPIGPLCGLKPGASLNIVRRGRMLVKPEAASGVARGARLFVRAVAGGGWSPGSLRGSADGSNTVDCSNQGEWLSEIDAEGFAELEIDFLAKGGI